MRCHSERTLQRYVDSELPPHRRQVVQEHLGRCEGCRRRLRRLEQESARVASLFVDRRPGPELGPRVLAGIRTAERPPHRRSVGTFRRWPRWIWAGAGAAVLCLVILVFQAGEKVRVVPPTLSRVVLVSMARVEGRPAEAHIFHDRGTGIQFIWLEKNEGGFR